MYIKCIAFDLLAFESAKNQLIRLEDAILSLDFMPERYQNLLKSHGVQGV